MSHGISYYSCKHKLSECGFGKKLQDQLHYRLIAEINMSKIQQKLLLLSKPTFQAVRTVCEQDQDVSEICKSDSAVLYNKLSNTNHFRTTSSGISH